MAVYLGLLSQARPLPEEIVRRIHTFSATVESKMKEMPEKRHAFAFLHWAFGNVVKGFLRLPELGSVSPQDLGLTPYFPTRERQCVGTKLKPVVSVQGVSLPLVSTKRLGSGQFGVVKETLYAGQPVAIKRVVVGRPGYYDWDALMDTVGEAQLLMRLAHPNIVRCMGFFMYGDGKLHEDGEANSGPHDVMKLALVLTRVRPMHHKLFQNWPMRETLTFFLGLGMGLDYLHQHDIAHGDVKVANSGVDDAGVAMLLDFGMWNRTTVTAHEALRCSLEQLGGTYPAPEAIAQRAKLACGEDQAVRMKPIGDTNRTMGPPYVSVQIPDFETLSLKGLDVFAFGVSLYEAVKSKVPVLDDEGERDLCPCYRPKHHNFNFMRDHVVLNGPNTKWKPNPVFAFLDGASMFSTVYPIVMPEFAWVQPVVAGCLAEDPEARWSMGDVVTALRSGLFAISDVPALPDLCSDRLGQACVVVDDLDWERPSESCLGTVDSWLCVEDDVEAVEAREAREDVEDGEDGWDIV